MSISEKIYLLRTKSNLTQEDLANKLFVSHQSVQKWENGLSLPTLDKLLTIATIFNVSMDYLCERVDDQDNSGRVDKEFIPDYGKMHSWESYAKSLEIEYRELFDEGKDVENLKDVFFSIAKMPSSKYKDDMADSLFKISETLPIRKDYPFVEPNEYNAIKALRNNSYNTIDTLTLTDEELLNKVKGGWYGRICGCYLGKPVECIRMPDMKKVLTRTNNYPLNRYIDLEDIEKIDTSDISFPIKSRSYPKDFNKMPSDDDTNYILIAYEVLKRYGRDFTSSDVAEVWLSTQTKYAYCTAERVAYKNLINGFLPPLSGEYKNAYREWIGAQIRADFYGYINPGNPEKAAEMAYKDARISHVKNGIYGSMWVASMIAKAFETSDIKTIIKAGLSQIPSSSRLFKAVSNIIETYDKGIPAETCLADIRTRYNEEVGYDWCHTISNAEIVAAGLLYGNKDYGKSICLAVGTCFDTDCNGATVGSVLGTAIGYEAIPDYWKNRINDTLESTLMGYSTVSISDMAKKTLDFIGKN